MLATTLYLANKEAGRRGRVTSRQHSNSWYRHEHSVACGAHLAPACRTCLLPYHSGGPSLLFTWTDVGLNIWDCTSPLPATTTLRWHAHTALPRACFPALQTHYPHPHTPLPHPAPHTTPPSTPHTSHLRRPTWPTNGWRRGSCVRGMSLAHLCTVRRLA